MFECDECMGEYGHLPRCSKYPEKKKADHVKRRGPLSSDQTPSVKSRPDSEY
ncbi:hypothetical protein TIN2_35 [Tsukamurella phage TIN2]|uniref:Uncharacterized protein n=1 Tax=Tsukamurella phage TIN2 TaxID=1636545 RepID=A0A0K0N4X3_9CAUD|nr:hypothetical protein AVT55_gp088 [Tsukamurella phage TIN2]AKJ71725.1 hypothetical protein TIN2_35 [Tsukamurella phage TIN2]